MALAPGATQLLLNLYRHSNKLMQDIPRVSVAMKKKRNLYQRVGNSIVLLMALRITTMRKPRTHLGKDLLPLNPRFTLDMCVLH